MDLFTPILPVEQLHPNFRNVLVPQRAGERAIVQSWAQGFPDRDGKFLGEFQRTFNSSFWEVYLHGLFKEYGFGMDWRHSRPDFWLKTEFGEVIVEAVTANAAAGATPEWEKTSRMTKEVANKNFWPLNREAIIRLSNALMQKAKKFENSYSKLPHVPGKPFVLAVAPFEQPDFQYQYDRPIQALLYDHYVDETAFFKDPKRFPNGPPSVKLGSVEKDSGNTIDLGIFLNDTWSEVSAVIFSCVATWGKAVAMSTQPSLGFIETTWGEGPHGIPTRRLMPIGVPSECISDGLLVFHNPYARNPLKLETFRKPGVVQHYLTRHEWRDEGKEQSLQFRLAQRLHLHVGKPKA